jgi:hypothetical protein
MAWVRFIFIGMLAVHLVAIPVAGSSPCAAGGTGTGTCCMRHQTGTGGAVIGHCACQAAPDVPANETVASTPPPPHANVVGVLSEGLSAEIFRPREPQSPTADATHDGADSGPPRLTGSGFRC